MKKIVTLFFTVFCCSALMVFQAAAYDARANTTRINLPDGGYIIEEIDDASPTVRAATTTSKEPLI